MDRFSLHDVDDFEEGQESTGGQHKSGASQSLLPVFARRIINFLHALLILVLLEGHIRSGQETRANATSGFRKRVSSHLRPDQQEDTNAATDERMRISACGPLRSSLPWT